MTPASDAWKTMTRLISEIASFAEVGMTPRPSAVIHFGSSVRPPLQYESDVDLLFFFQSLPSGRIAAQDIFVPLELHCVPYLNELRAAGFNYELSPIAKSEQAAKFFSPLYLDLVDRSKILFDPSGLADQLIQRSKRFIERNGSRREYISGRPVWIYNPNLKSGEHFTDDF